MNIYVYKYLFTSLFFYQVVYCCLYCFHIIGIVLSISHIKNTSAKQRTVQEKDESVAKDEGKAKVEPDAY